MLMPGPRPTIVLVHGAFANTSTWSKLIPLLVAKGFSVVAVHCPLSSLADDVAAVERVIGMQDAPVLLVGHSWGGATITEAGNDAILLHATQGPFAQASNDEKITHAAWRDKPSWFVLGENDHMLLPELEKATARKLGARKTLVLTSSHLPMLSEPYAVADFIQDAASQLGSGG
jgi:pimeloyl-ACP methyl ester carboxylesterase